MCPQDNPSERISVNAAIASAFDDSSIPTTGPPELVLIMGGVAVGKTRMRREKYSRSYVVLDAGDIFIDSCGGEDQDFPSFLETPMEVIGAAISRRAVSERRNIVVEMIGAKFEPMRELIDAFKAIGYRVSIIPLTVDIDVSWGWNVNRSKDNISAFYTEAYHRKWLLDAVVSARPASGRP